MSSNLQVQRICQHCGNEFTARTTTTLYCSHRCNSAAYKAKQRAGKVEQINKETQRIKSEPIEQLKAKAFLSIADTCKLIGISRRTVYRLIERGELITGKAGKRTIIRRSDLEQLLFEQPRTVTPQPEKQAEQKQFDIAECYNLTEVQSKYSISETALQNLIKRNSIPKIKKGWFAYVPKTVIDKLLSQTPNS
ncbi:MAG: helix-turn-helix domain-containing protein [Cyclobacteriaceae bacterium]|jgi:excisionase family DNA binding protein